MDWTENAILSITTRSVFFFDNDEQAQKTCQRICEQLDIDLFPGYEGKTYSRFAYGKNEWTQEKLSENQKIMANTPFFDQQIIDKFEQAPSNLLFVFDGHHFKGVFNKCREGMRGRGYFNRKWTGCKAKLPFLDNCGIFCNIRLPR